MDGCILRAPKPNIMQKKISQMDENNNNQPINENEEKDRQEGKLKIFSLIDPPFYIT